MNMKLVTAIAVITSMPMSAVPAGAQHGGGHGGGAGHAAAPVHGDGIRGAAVVGHAVPRTGPTPHVRAPLHTIGGRYYPSVHTYIGLGLSSGYAYYGYAWPYGYGFPFAHPYGVYAYGYPAYGYPPAIAAYGDIRIQGAPKDAQVYVDGYYAGIVDDFDGTFQRLNVEAGLHRIEIVLPGARPLAFDVNAQPGRTITIRP